MAIARAVRSGKSTGSDYIRNKLRFNIRKSDLDRKISVWHSLDQGRLIVSGDPILMSYFHPVEIKGARKREIIKRRGEGVKSFELRERKLKRAARTPTGGVQVEIIKGRKTLLKGGRFVNLPIHVGRPFIARGRGGTPLVLARKIGENKLYTYKLVTEVTLFYKGIRFVTQRIADVWGREIHRYLTRAGW